MAGLPDCFVNAYIIHELSVQTEVVKTYHAPAVIEDNPCGATCQCNQPMPDVWFCCSVKYPLCNDLPTV